jgi:hypothetical protein
MGQIPFPSRSRHKEASSEKHGNALRGLQFSGFSQSLVASAIVQLLIYGCDACRFDRNN